MTTISSTNTTNTSSTTNSSSLGLSANFDTFISLLTAQLKAQDPLSPMDTKDFTNQLVQFTGVEQQIKTNDLLSSLSNSMSLSNSASAVSYLGKTATAATNVAGFEDGKVTWNYNVPSAASSVSLKIYDENNKLVKTIDGETSAGDKTLTWDGTNSSGTKLTSGEYYLVADAKNAAGQSLNISMVQSGTISYVDMSGDEPLVKLNGASVPLSALQSVSL